MGSHDLNSRMTFLLWYHWLLTVYFCCNYHITILFSLLHCPFCLILSLLHSATSSRWAGHRRCGHFRCPFSRRVDWKCFLWRSPSTDDLREFEMKMSTRNFPRRSWHALRSIGRLWPHPHHHSDAGQHWRVCTKPRPLPADSVPLVLTIRWSVITCTLNPHEKIR